MNMTSSRALVRLIVLLSAVSVSACSQLTDVSDTVLDAASAVSPFQQQTETGASTPAPANQRVPSTTSPASIRVEVKPPAPKRQPDVDVSLGTNKQCTTFCALPTRKRPVN